MDPLTYVASGFVRDFGAWIAVVVFVAAALSIPVMLFLVVAVRRIVRELDRIAAARESSAAPSSPRRIAG